MSRIVLHILNSNGVLTKDLPKIERAYDKSILLAKKLLGLKIVDVVVRNYPYFTIPELHIGGFTGYDGSSIILSLDVEKGIKEKDLFSQFLHEFHHAARFQKNGWGETLGDMFVNEGLACLFEEEITSRVPIYAKVKITDKQITDANSSIKSEKYDYDEWFFGSKSIPRWFGYTYGYQLTKRYAKINNSTAAKLVAISSDKFIDPESK